MPPAVPRDAQRKRRVGLPQAEATGQVQFVHAQAPLSGAPWSRNETRWKRRSPAPQGLGADKMHLPCGFSPGPVVVAHLVGRGPRRSSSASWSSEPLPAPAIGRRRAPPRGSSTSTAASAGVHVDHESAHVDDHDDGLGGVGRGLRGQRAAPGEGGSRGPQAEPRGRRQGGEAGEGSRAREGAEASQRADGLPSEAQGLGGVVRMMSRMNSLSASWSDEWWSPSMTRTCRGAARREADASTRGTRRACPSSLPT